MIFMLPIRTSPDPFPPYPSDDFSLFIFIRRVEVIPFSFIYNQNLSTTGVKTVLRVVDGLAPSEALLLVTVFLLLVFLHRFIIERLDFVRLIVRPYPCFPRVPPRRFFFVHRFRLDQPHLLVRTEGHILRLTFGRLRTLFLLSCFLVRVRVLVIGIRHGSLFLKDPTKVGIVPLRQTVGLLLLLEELLVGLDELLQELRVLPDGLYGCRR
jgi:hypothetical protein